MKHVLKQMQYRFAVKYGTLSIYYIYKIWPEIQILFVSILSTQELKNKYAKSEDKNLPQERQLKSSKVPLRGDKKAKKEPQAGKKGIQSEPKSVRKA